jgi:hypothetical protein
VLAIGENTLFLYFCLRRSINRISSEHVSIDLVFLVFSVYSVGGIWLDQSSAFAGLAGKKQSRNCVKAVEGFVRQEESFFCGVQAIRPA